MGKDKRKAGTAARAPQRRSWTAAAGARAAREARIRTVTFLRDAPIAREIQLGKTLGGLEILGAQVGDRAARAVLLGGIGLPPPYPTEPWHIAELTVHDEATHLADAPVYIVSPSMCNVVLAAAQTLDAHDLALMDVHDPPTPAGIVVLPHPVLVRAVNGELGDDRVYTWRSPITALIPGRFGGRGKPRPRTSMRTSIYHDAAGPVRPGSFTAMATDAAHRGTPLPPWLLDAVRSEPLNHIPTARQLAAQEAAAAIAAHHGQARRDARAAAGVDDTERVIGEYTPGQEILDHDDRFTTRFLYAFFRLCSQPLTTTEQAPVTHASAQLAERAGIDPEVRVVELRSREHRTTDGEPSGRNWQHQWVVRMHKVRQWYPSEQRHRIIYRGPYVKGPADKPLLGGDTVHGVTRG